MVATEWIDLTGKIHLNADRSLPFPMPLSLKGGDYYLEGNLLIHKEDFRNIDLNAELEARHVYFSDVEVDKVTCHLNIKKDSLLFSHVSAVDWMGRMWLKHLSLTKNFSDWEIKLDHGHLENVRLSRLKGKWQQNDKKRKSFLRNLYIPYFSIDDFSGFIGKKESLSGKGRVQFTSVPKKNFFSSLLFLPTEITARIGLDLTNLVPVMGTVFYEIKDNKVFLLELKDMFSEGKRSRFYLADQSPAYIDFDGNLNFKIKMKQYNLLMKLAEFFTISVKGNLLKPVYTFSNHLSDEENF